MVILGGDFWDESCGLSDCDSVTWTGVLFVTDVPFSTSSSVVVMSEVVALDWKFVEPQSFSFSKKGSIVGVENQEGMSFEETPVRRMMPPTPQQSSYSSIEARQ